MVMKGFLREMVLTVMESSWVSAAMGLEREVCR
jgi:hypothetical protein